MVIDLTSSTSSPSAAPTGLVTTSATKKGAGLGVVGGGLTDGDWT